MRGPRSSERPYLFALAAGGRAGVERILGLFAEDVVRSMTHGLAVGARPRRQMGARRRRSLLES